MKKSFFKVADNSPVLFEFAVNSNDSLEVKSAYEPSGPSGRSLSRFTEIDKHELKLT